MINGVDIVHLNTSALRISGSDVSTSQTYLSAVEFDTLEVTDASGISVGESFLGVDLSEEAVTKTVDSVLVIDVDHDFTGSITTTANVSLDGDFISSDRTQKIFQDALWKFINGDPSVKKIKLSHAEGGSALEEPVITSINSGVLSSILSSHWSKHENITIPYQVDLGNVTISGVLNADHLDNEALSLTDWRDTYLSLTQPQEISGSYSYDGGLTVNGDFSSNYVFISDTEGNEGLLKTETHEHKFLEHYFTVSLALYCTGTAR